jgi:hypothetical protein
MQKTDKWSEQVSFYRFFSNDRVKEEDLINYMQNHCKEYCRGKQHLLLIEDTTELNMEKHRNRIMSKDKLGLTGNNVDLGFFCHPTVAIDPSDASLIGIIDLHLWHREEDKEDKKKRNYQHLAFESKESWRWAKRAVESRQRLQEVPTITVVQDREGDIYESFCTLGQSGVDWVIRSSHNRMIECGKLHEQINNFPIAGEYEVVINSDNKKHIKRNAMLEIGYGTVEIRCPRSIVNAEKYPQTLSVQVVYVKEKADSVPKGGTAIEWILYTSHSVNNFEESKEIIYYYRLRWLIEDLFRTLKSKGVNYEASELESGKALRKLLVMALMAAIQILQLRQARDGTTQQLPCLVFSEEELTCMEDLLPRFEGKTEKQKNPYPKNNLAWASWIIARLGGWKGYTSQRPPGVITLHDGWIRFHQLFEGWKLAKDVYKR